MASTLQTCTAPFFCAESERALPPSSCAKFYVKSQGTNPGIYTSIHIVRLNKSEPYPIRATSYEDALTKWRDVCIAIHTDADHESEDTLPAPARPRPNGDELASPTKYEPRLDSSPAKRGPRLDSSFLPTPSTPSTPTPKRSQRSVARLPNSSPARSHSPIKGRLYASPSPSSSQGSSSSRSSAMYFLCDAEGTRTVYSSASQAIEACDRETEAGRNCTVTPCGNHGDVLAFLCGEDL